MKATGTPLIVVCIAGRPLDLRRASEQADALLMAWYPGARGGDAVAETILGRNNPAGRLPIAVPPRRRANSRLLQQKTPCEPRLHRSHGRAALSVRLRAELLDIRIRQPRSAAERRQRPRSQLPHTQHLGPRRRRSRTALHLGHGPPSTGTQPPRQLGGFRRIRLAPGEQRQVSFTLGDEALALYRPAGPPRGGKGRLRHRRRLVVARYPPANNRNTRITS